MTVGWRPQLLTTWASSRPACLPSNMAAGFPQKKSRKEVVISFMTSPWKPSPTSLQVLVYSLEFILSLPHTKGEWPLTPPLGHIPENHHPCRVTQAHCPDGAGFGLRSSRNNNHPVAQLLLLARGPNT